MYSAIVVPLDGSPLGERALPTAIALASRFGAGLQLVHVREAGVYATGAPMFDTRLDDDEEQLIGDRVSALAERIAREETLKAEPVLLRGEIVPALSEHIAGRGIDLVVMTTHGRGGFSRAWFGSVADDLVRHAPVPVLLVRPNAERSPGVREPLFGRVLVPLDGSSRTDDTVIHAAALGTPNFTEVVLLTVIPDLARRLEEQRLRANAHLAGVADKLREIGAKVSTHTIVHRAPAPAILEFAEQQAVDLIVLSTRARSATDRIFTSSVADKVLRGAAAPVLIFGPTVSSLATS